ncbi:MAG: Gfo/Idh/MocA family oxidoreductase [Gordonia sp. (in: high G+C Gram-positive bacteria)]
MSWTVGVVGAGVISPAYLTTLTAADDISVAWIADIEPARAQTRAEAFAVPRWGHPDELLGPVKVDAVVNLTPPSEHAALTLRALRAGSHVWSEKPLGLDDNELRDIIRTAREVGRRVGSAPDTVLSPIAQAGIAAVRGGRIGTSTHALAIFQSAGPERWHPRPAPFFAAGAGPVLDMGPYYVTVLIQALGKPVAVSAVGGRSRTTRIALADESGQTVFPVDVDTHVSAHIEFESGAVATVVLSWDCALRRAGILEISGDKGTVIFPDPNRFDGSAQYRHLDGTVEELADSGTGDTGEGAVAGRGVGVIALLKAAADAQPTYVDDVWAAAVISTLFAVERAVRSGQRVPVEFVDAVAFEDGFTAPAGTF